MVPKFNELLEQHADPLEILEEVTAAGWSRQEVTLALKDVVAARVKAGADELRNKGPCEKPAR